ncbi:MAG TPA: hypothetical protein VFE61_09930 [Candidatus Sulfotelmatobacter sp.]|nr:hypothetical protein [Candidatus Sulfotelmatobacter sp.]
MSNKILIVGALACLSAMAVAQSDQSKHKTATQDQSAASRDAASRQASGKRMHKPITVTAEASGQDAQNGKVSGKTAADDWQAPSAKTTDPKTAQAQPRVAAGDVNVDGKADAAAPKNPAQGTAQKATVSTTNSNVMNPRDVATGQASGKRQHEPVAATKESNPKPEQK